MAKSDCLCLFGCPHIPLSKETVDRRAQQYKTLCDPTKDGKGNPCPIDDCAPPGDIACNDNVCAAPKKDGGK